MQLVSQVIIQYRDRFLMQLRDFDEEIASPGRWGFFAGHLEENETAELAMWREIWEELCWRPVNIVYLGSTTMRDRQMNIFTCLFSGQLSDLQLMEGQEIGVFSKQEIVNEELFSKRWDKCFRITDTSKAMFKEYVLESDFPHLAG